jgi:hypothetical protein
LNKEVTTEEVAGVLRAAGIPLTAPEIAAKLKCERSEVNSLLYRHVGEVFLRSNEERPKWRLLTLAVEGGGKRSDQVVLPHAATGPIHIDFQGGDWTVEIRSLPMSRNDPPVVVERTGPNRVAISVSMAYDSENSGDTIGSLSSAELVLAAGALVWEIACKQGAVNDSRFGWDIAMRDVLLSLAAHVRRLGLSEE